MEVTDMDPDRTYVVFHQDELRAEAAANRLARNSSTHRRFASRLRLAGGGRPGLSSRAAAVAVFVAVLSAVVASPVLAQKPAYPPGRPTPVPTVAPTPTPTPTPT